MVDQTTKTNSIIDWISVTVKSGRVSVSDWTNDYEERPKGLLGYTVQVWYKDGRIELSNPSRPDMGVHVIYNGECLRKMETMYAMDAIDIVKFHARQDHKFTRLDIAVDIVNGFSAKEAIERYEKGQCETKLRKANKNQEINAPGDTLYLGRRGGDRMMRIYDKAAQQKQDGRWTRVEGEYRAFGAISVVSAIMKAKDAKKAIYAILKGLVDYPEWKEYQEAMGGENMVLDIGRKVTNSTERWLLEKVAPSIAKFACEHDGWLDMFSAHVNDLINERIANGG